MKHAQVELVSEEASTGASPRSGIWAASVVGKMVLGGAPGFAGMAAAMVGRQQEPSGP